MSSQSILRSFVFFFIQHFILVLMCVSVCLCVYAVFVQDIISMKCHHQNIPALIVAPQMPANRMRVSAADPYYGIYKRLTPRSLNFPGNKLFFVQPLVFLRLLWMWPVWQWLLLLGAPTSCQPSLSGIWKLNCRTCTWLASSSVPEHCTSNKFEKEREREREKDGKTNNYEKNKDDFVREQISMNAYLLDGS